MPEIIEIENGIVRRKDITILGELRLEDLLPHLERRLPSLIGPIPANTRWLYDNQTDPTTRRIEMLIDLPPKVRTLPIRGEAVHPRVALPWTIFHFALRTHVENPNGMDWQFEYYRCFHARDGAHNLNQKVIPAMLPNVFENGEICFGTTAPRDVPPTLADRINQIVNEWYLSNFNNLGHTRRHYLPWHSRNYARWIRETENDPNCWQNWPEWDETDTTQQHIDLQNVWGTDIDTKTPIVLPDSIPDLPIAPTFGVAEDWLRQLNNNQRLRLQTAIANVFADDPNLFTAVADTDTIDEEEDF